MKYKLFPSLYLLILMNVHIVVGEDFVIKDVLESQAEKYLLEKFNIRTFSERFKPFATYWAARDNDIQAYMTFRFPLEKPLKSGQLFTNLVSVNANNNKAYGSGVGHGSLWCSADGKKWYLLLDAPPPEKTFLKGYDCHRKLPGELVGAREIWLQVRLLAKGMKDSTYSVAQFARKATNDPNSNVLLLRVKYDDLPSQDSLPQKPDRQKSK